MEIQTTRPVRTCRQDLVLYVYLSFGPGSGPHTVFNSGMAIVHEENTKVSLPDDIESILAADSVLYCHGEGLEDFSVSLACADIFLKEAHLSNIKGLVESWILSCAAGRSQDYFIRAEVCYESPDRAYIGKPETWVCSESDYAFAPVVGVTFAQQYPSSQLSSLRVPIT